MWKLSCIIGITYGNYGIHSAYKGVKAEGKTNGEKYISGKDLFSS